jgi:hypothetical protein
VKADRAPVNPQRSHHDLTATFRRQRVRGLLALVREQDLRALCELVETGKVKPAAARAQHPPRKRRPSRDSDPERGRPGGVSYRL